MINDTLIINDLSKDKSKIGYARVSTIEQNEARQLELFKPLNLYRIYIDKISGKNTNRPMLQSMFDYIREGDTIYVSELSRLARNTKDLLEITELLKNKKIQLISIKENIDTNTPTGKLMLTMIGAINEFEVANLKERQKEGIAIAKAEGRFTGRTKIKKPKNWNDVFQLYMCREISCTKAMELTELKKSTFFRFLKEERNKNNV